MNINRTAILTALLVLLIVVFFVNRKSFTDSASPSGRDDARHITQSALLVGNDTKIQAEDEIPVNNMEDLHFKTKQEIYDLRKQCVREHGNLISSYEPSEAVFGQIADRMPWWGIYGIYGQGPGERSIEGPSEESRFLLNPYLLVGLSERNAFTTAAPLDKTLAFYPKPLRIRWQTGTSLETIEYIVTDHFLYVSDNHFYPTDQRKLLLIAYNARDLGFGYLYIDSDKSEGVAWANGTSQAVAIRQFIHRGTSCGYPGGCNNMSPHQPELEIDVNRTPAKAHIKLWKTYPRDVNGSCDMAVIIEMR